MNRVYLVTIWMENLSDWAHLEMGTASLTCSWRALALLWSRHSTAVLFTWRVITANLSLQGKSLRWSDKNKRRQIAKVIAMEGFPGCIGFVDRTCFSLQQRLRTDPETYSDQHQQYSINVIILCNLTDASIRCPLSTWNEMLILIFLEEWNLQPIPADILVIKKYHLIDKIFRRLYYVIERIINI